MGNRNRRAEPTTNKLKRRLSLTLTGRPLVSPRSESQRMVCEHVGLFGLSSAEVQGQTTPRTVPLSEPARQSRKKRKATPIDDRLHATPSNGCDQSLFLESLGHLTHSSLPISFLFSRSFASSFNSLSLLFRFLAPISPLPVLLSTSSLFRERSAPPRCIVHTLSYLSVWVYHRDFGATPSVIYGK